MATKAPTFDQWVTFMRGTDYNRTHYTSFQKLNPGDQRTLYKYFLDRYNNDPGNYGTDSHGAHDKISAATDHAIPRFQDFQKTANTNPNAPAAKDAPAGTPTPAGQAALTAAQQKAAATAGTPAGKANNDFYQALLKNNGVATNWSPWMTLASVAGTQDLGNDQSGNPQSLNADQVQQFMQTWNTAHPDDQFSDPSTFMADDRVKRGTPDVVAAFQAAFGLGSHETRSYAYNTNETSGGMDWVGGKNAKTAPATDSVAVDGAAAAAASDPTHGGVPALDKYMGNIVRDAQQNGVPWQILWGVLRARLNTDPNSWKGNGLFGLGPEAQNASSPEAQIAYLASSLKAGFDQTKDWAFAALYTDNPQSAMQLYHTGHSAPGRAQEDGMYVDSVLGGAQGTNTLSIYALGFGRTGLDGAHTRDNLITNQSGGIGSGGSGAAAGPTINLPDMNALTQSAAQLIQQYLLRAPNPGEAEAIAAQMRDASIQAQQQGVAPTLTPEQVIAGETPAAGAAKIVPNDPASSSAAELANIKNSAEYKGLYAKKPAGMTDDDYAKQFVNTEQGMGSTVQDTGALRAGMQTGSTDVTGGQIFSGDNANSSFRQRLYQIANSLAST